MEKKHRIFVAFDLPPPVRGALRAHALLIGAGRPVPEDQLHVTLRFAGEADERRITRFRLILSDIAPGRIRLVPAGIALFPPRAREPRGVWAEFEDRSGALDRLAKRVEVAAIRAGFPPEDRPFRPHATILRLGRGHGPVDLRLDRYRMEPFDGGSFTLYESRLTPDGPVYTVLERYGDNNRCSL